MLNDISIVRPGQPSLAERIKTNICKKVSRKQREVLNIEYSNSTIEKDFSIIASFCGGDFISRHWHEVFVTYC